MRQCVNYANTLHRVTTHSCVCMCLSVRHDDSLLTPDRVHYTVVFYF